jgi:4-hydroxyproline epimerase
MSGACPSLPARLRVVDSHTLGEPTRVVVDPAATAWLAGTGSVRQQRDAFGRDHDAIRRALVADPRGADAMVGVILAPPVDPRCRFGAIYFNRVGFLDMCGHATIGLAVTLGHLGWITPGRFGLETPAGVVAVTWDGADSASFENVPARRTARGVRLRCDDGREVSGDIATSGLWFFITADHGETVEPAAIPRLTARGWAIRRALAAAGLTGDAGAVIDHVVLLGPPADPGHDGRNFVLCPDGAFDRSPCGTGTSALVGCLHEDGRLAEGATWRQESILGGVYEASVRREAGAIVPTVRGRAWITGESVLWFAVDDPYRLGLPPLTPRGTVT